MSDAQLGAATALALIGIVLIVISAVCRDSRLEPFADRLTKVGLLVGGLFFLPLLFMIVTVIVLGK